MTQILRATKTTQLTQGKVTHDEVCEAESVGLWKSWSQPGAINLRSSASSADSELLSHRGQLPNGIWRRQSQAENLQRRRPELAGERAGVVRQTVAGAHRLDARRDFRVAVARHVREQMMLDLVAQVAA